MAILMNLYYTGKNGSAKKFVVDMIRSGIVDTIRSRPGNEKYEYFFSAEDPETVLLVDK